MRLASLRPSQMAATGVVVWQLVVWQRVPVTVLRKKAALPMQDTAKVRGDGQKPSMRRTCRDEPATQGKVLYSLQGMSVNPAFTYRKACVYPGRSEDPVGSDQARQPNYLIL